MSRKYTKNGIEYPSVTTVLGKWQEGQGLIDWAVNVAVDCIKDSLNHVGAFDEALRLPRDWNVLELARKAHINYRDEAGQKGTRMHDVLETYINARMQNTELPEAPQAFLDWEKKHVIRWVASEKPVYNDYQMYAGTLDAIAVLKDGKKEKGYYIDFKTSKSYHKSWRWQVAAYAIADLESRFQGVELQGHVLRCGTGILHIKGDDIKWIDGSKHLLADYEAFLSILNAYYSTASRRLKGNWRVM